MTSLTPQSVVTHSEQVLFTEIDDSMALMDMDSGKYFDYDATGAEVWKLVDGERSVAQICDALLTRFDVDATTCQSDTLEFLQELEWLSLVTVR